MSNTFADIWTDRRVKIGYETAEELAHKFNEANWRGHPEAQADALDESLDTLGWVGSVKVNLQTGKIFDGHLRVKRALLKDPSISIPVDYYDLSPDEELLALQIHDAITEQAQPIPEKLAALMERTRSLVADKPGLAGMLEQLRLKAGMNGKGQAPEELPPPVDKAAELQEVWQVQPGQIWQADRHFIICGDCRDGDTWKRLLEAAGIEKVNGCFTSPPYAEQRKAQYGGVPTDKYVEWWEAVQGNVRTNLAGDGSFFVNIKPHAESLDRSIYVFDLVCAMVRVYGWHFLDEYCWLRNGIPQKVTNRFKNDFEPVYAFVLGEFKFRPEEVRHFSNNVPVPLGVGAGDTNAAKRQGTGMAAVHGNTESPGMAYPSNLLKFVARDETTGHPAAFPVALPTFFIKAYSDPGDSWLDPFCGSGTTIVSCAREGRIGLGVEKLEKYVAVILQRLSDNLGIKPILLD